MGTKLTFGKVKKIISVLITRIWKRRENKQVRWSVYFRSISDLHYMISLLRQTWNAQCGVSHS